MEKKILFCIAGLLWGVFLGASYHQVSVFLVFLVGAMGSFCFFSLPRWQEINISSHARSFYRGPFLPLILLIAVAFLSSFWSLKPGKTFVISLRFFGILSLVLCGRWAIEKMSVDLCKNFFYALLVLFVVVFVLGVCFSTFKGFLLRNGIETEKIHGKAQVTMVISALPLVLLWISKKTIPPFIQGVIFVVAFCLAYVAASEVNVTTGKIALFVAVVVAFAFYYKPSYPWAWMGTVGFILSCLFLLMFSHFIVQKFSYFYGNRGYIWEFVADHILQKPLLGWGANAGTAIPGAQSLHPVFGNLMIPAHPHNNLLQLWLDLGITGPLLGGWALYSILKRVDRDVYWGAMQMATLTVIFVIANASYSLWHSWWWSWVGVVYLMQHLLRKIQNEL